MVCLHFTILLQLQENRYYLKTFEYMLLQLKWEWESDLIECYFLHFNLIIVYLFSFRLLRLLDTRYRGIARGVGQSEILGRIHVAPIKVRNSFEIILYFFFPQFYSCVILCISRMVKGHRLVLVCFSTVKSFYLMQKILFICILLM